VFARARENMATLGLKTEQNGLGRTILKDLRFGNPIYLPEGRNAPELSVFDIRAAHRSRTISFFPSSLSSSSRPSARAAGHRPLSLPLISHAPPEGWEVGRAVGGG
jgi:hypothetical protein